MSRDKTQLRMDGIAFSTPAGSRVVIPPGSEVIAHSPVIQLFDGVGFGPLAVLPKAGGTAEITRVEYEIAGRRASRDGQSRDVMVGGALTATATAGIETEPKTNGERRELTDTAHVTRRELLGIGATVVGTGWVATDHALDSPGAVVAEAEIDLSTNTRGVRIGLLPTGPAQPTEDPSYEAEFAGSDVGDIDGQNDILDVPPKSTGTVSIQAKTHTT